MLRIYQRLRPGNPPQLEKARQLFQEKFYDVNRYRLGRVGRFRISRKLNLDVSDKEMTLRPEDMIASIAYLLDLASNGTESEIDDIDHLGNRRLANDLMSWRVTSCARAFSSLRRTVQERMSLKDIQEMTPRSLINPKSISAAIEYFFGRGELSQVVDQTNPLSMLTHERRLSALGPGGLNRKRAGFRSPRRAHFALRPDLPDRNAGGYQHRLDLQLGDLRRRRRLRLPRHALPQSQSGQADRRRRLVASRRRIGRVRGAG